MSSVHKTIVFNTIWLSVSEFASSILLFFFTVIVAKYLGAEKYGQLAFALSMATLFAVLVDFGLGIFTIREVARKKELAQKYINGIFTLRAVLSIGFLILMVVVAAISNKGTLVTALVFLASLYMVFNHFTQACNAIFRAYERMKYEAVGKFVFALVLLGGGLIFVQQGHSLIYFGWAYAIAMFITLLYSLFVIRKFFVPISIQIDISFWKYLLKQSWPFALSFIFISVYYFVGTVMLGFMGQDREVGWYNAGYKIIFFIMLFAQVLGGVIFPVISRYYQQAFDRLRGFLSNFMKFIIAIAIPLGVGGTILGGEIIELIFGKDFLGGVVAFKILIWTAVAVYLSIMYANALQAFDRQKVYVKAVGIGAAVNVVMNLVLIPVFSLNGAAIATLLSELSVLIFMYIKLRQIVKVEVFKNFLKPIMASVIMAIVIYLLKDWHVLFVIVLGSTSYAFLMILFRGFAKDEIGFILNLFRIQKNDA